MMKGNDSLDRRSDVGLGRAMAAEWRRMYPQNTIGRLCQDMDVSRKAAESLLAGGFSSTTMGRIIAAYGPGWVAERVLEAAGTNLEEYFDHKAEQLEKAAATAKAKASEARERSQNYKAARRSCLAQDGVDADQNL